MTYKPSEVPATQEVIRVGILQDDFGTSFSSPEEERQEIMRTLGEWLDELPMRLVTYGSGSKRVFTQADFDLLVVDYGGASVAYGLQERVNWELAATRKWAEEHPGKLLMVWTTTTVRAYQEIAAQYDDLDNVVLKGSDFVAAKNKLRAWYAKPNEETDGITVEIEEEEKTYPQPSHTSPVVNIQEVQSLPLPSALPAFALLPGQPPDLEKIDPWYHEQSARLLTQAHQASNHFATLDITLFEVEPDTLTLCVSIRFGFNMAAYSGWSDY